MVKIGIIGAGSIARFHAIGLATINKAKLYGVVDINKPAAEKLAKEFGAVVFDNVDSMLADKEIDAVDICLPTTLHHEYALKSAKAGKHVFCEKPIARTIKQAQEMIDVCKKENVKLMIGHVLRYFPEYRRAKQMIDNGSLGKIGMVRLSRLNTFPVTGSGWYSDIESSGGVVLDMIIHDFDFLQWCFGKPTRVYSQGLAYRVSKDQLLDYALVSFRFKNDTIAHVEGSWAETSGFSANFEIAGSKGLINFDMKKNVPFLLSTRATRSGAAGVNVPESPLKQSPYASELKHFVDCVLNDKQPEISGKDAMISLEIALAVLESIKTGQVVEL